jgi:hypothetical protein
LEEWEFEYGRAQNDTEFGHEGRYESTEEMNQGTAGKWVHRVTGESLASKGVEFTVIGYVNISAISPNEFIVK